MSGREARHALLQHTTHGEEGPEDHDSISGVCLGHGRAKGAHGVGMAAGHAAFAAWGGRWMEMFDGYIDGTPDLIERLHARKVPLYALTNMPSETWPLMQRHFGPVLGRFRRVVVSGDLGMVKPDAAIYRHTLEAIGNPDPACVLFIDDSAPNIAAADKLGFVTHHFTGAAGLEAALAHYGLV